MIYGVDTNLLVYAEGFGEEEKVRRAKSIVRDFGHAIVIPTLVIGDLYRVLHRKAKRPAAQAARDARAWSESHGTCDVTTAAITSALALASEHNLHIWDAAALASCASAGCSVFLSEDLQAGFKWGSIRIVNPFADVWHGD